MLLRRIMNTKISEERLSHSLPADAKVEEFDLKGIEKGVTYEVVDGNGKKVGEIDGDRLRFLIRAEEKIPWTDILDMVEDGFILIDEKGLICYENEAYGDIIGIPERELVGRSMYEVEPEALILVVLNTGEPVILKNRIFPTMGCRVDMQIYPLKEDGRVIGAFSLFHDVTKVAMTQDELPGSARVTPAEGQFGDEYKQYPPRVIWRSGVFSRLIEKVTTVSQTDATVMIRGESGVGKEVIARLIHQNSDRADKPMVAVNCAAIPENLIESELFGYEEGAFTGAKKGGKPGKFEQANGGTLFLDEIGDMPYTMQAKVLRAIQEGEVERIGGRDAIPVDVRIITATNQPLEEMVAAHRFRKDLYYRLNVIEITVPPLRERREDILPLANHFLEEYNRKYGKDVRIAPEAYVQLGKYDWPGNVRELQNAIEQLVIITPTGIVDDVPLLLEAASRREEAVLSGDAAEAAERTLADIEERRYSLEDAVERYERDLILRALEACGGDRTAAIKKLGMSSRTFYRRLEGIDRKNLKR